MIAAYESGQHSMESKDYRAALAYFDLAAAGSANPAFAHYQRARAYAMLGNRKGTLAELRLALAAGFHDESALSAGEFQVFSGTGGISDAGGGVESGGRKGPGQSLSCGSS